MDTFFPILSIIPIGKKFGSNPKQTKKWLSFGEFITMWWWYMFGEPNVTLPSTVYAIVVHLE